MYTPSFLHKETQIAPLSWFRIAFGALILFSTIRFWALGWIDTHYLENSYHFTYYGFDWVQVYSPSWLYTLFGLLACSSLLVSVGLFYRPAIVILFLSFTYIELLDKSYYLNHYYFVSVAAFMLIWLPANANHSLDALFRPSLRRNEVPYWCVFAPQLLLAIVYVAAGIAKMQSEWLLEAQPLRIWLPAKDHLPIIGPLFALPATPYLFAWAGMLFDSSIPFLLWWKKSRPLAYLAVIVFHALTGLLFQIGVFPLVMIALTPVFFDPLGWRKRLSLFELSTIDRKPTFRQFPWLAVSQPVLALFFLLQLLIPFRPLWYPGNMFWTEEGYRFGWRVMLAEKAGTATFYVKSDQNALEQVVDNSEFLNPHQEKQMAFQPDMILQFAHFLEAHYQQEYGIKEPQIRCEAYVTWNARPSQLLIEPAVDLTHQKRGWQHKAWVTEAPN
jgi:hypothetical protein